MATISTQLDGTTVVVTVSSDEATVTVRIQPNTAAIVTPPVVIDQKPVTPLPPVVETPPAVDNATAATPTDADPIADGYDPGTPAQAQPGQDYTGRPIETGGASLPTT